MENDVIYSLLVGCCGFPLFLIIVSFIFSRMFPEKLVPEKERCRRATLLAVHLENPYPGETHWAVRKYDRFYVTVRFGNGRPRKYSTTKKGWSECVLVLRDGPPVEGTLYYTRAFLLFVTVTDFEPRIREKDNPPDNHKDANAPPDSPLNWP